MNLRLTPEASFRPDMSSSGYGTGPALNSPKVNPTLSCAHPQWLFVI
jgi:hypothetical protein